MKITEEQQALLESMYCERFSADEENLRAVGSFCNYKNSTVAEALLNEAYEEDEKGTIAYYLVKDSDGDILFFFSLKCGLLFDEFIEGERLQKIQAFYNFLLTIRNSSEVDEAERKLIDTLLEQTRAKKGIKKADVAQIVHKSKESEEIEELLSSGMKNVGKTFPGIEIVHFCANDDESCRNKWLDYHFDQKIGAVVFWHFIVPIVQKVMERIGCEYLYLFAADLTEDEHLVNYYRTYMNFRVEEEHGAAIPLYDFACKFMYQSTNGLNDARNRFFESFNHDINAV